VVGYGDEVPAIPLGTYVTCGAGFTSGNDRLTASGRPHLSPLYATVGLQANGGFAEYCTVPASTCLPTMGLPPDAAALAQPMAIAVHAIRRGRISDGESVVVIGVGGIGAFVVAAAVQHGADVTAVDLDQSRLEIASDLGAQKTIQAQDKSLTEALSSSPPDMIVEATGSPAGYDLAAAVAAPTCRIVIVGLQAAPNEVDLRVLSQREHELIGSNAQDTSVDLPEAVRLLRARATGWGRIAPAAIPLEDIVREGIEPLVDRHSSQIKTLIDPWISQPRSTDTAPRDE
jgi:(R,R)-butanediol dehydrogenase/meso-butanediol dehydrogenase/diacetyl reductase